MTEVKIKRCSYKDCKSNSTDDKVLFFNFPIKEQRSNKWIKACGNDQVLKKRTMKTLASKYYVCSNHFTSRDFFKMIAPFKTKLKTDSIPMSHRETLSPIQDLLTENNDKVEHRKATKRKFEDFQIPVIKIKKFKNISEYKYRKYPFSVISAMPSVHSRKSVLTSPLFSSKERMTSTRLFQVACGDGWRKKENNLIELMSTSACEISIPENKFEMQLLNDSAPEEENASKKPRLDLTELPPNTDSDGQTKKHSPPPLLKETVNTSDSILDQNMEEIFKDIVSPKSDISLSLEESLLRLEESDESDSEDTKKEESVIDSSEKNNFTINELMEKNSEATQNNDSHTKSLKTKTDTVNEDNKKSATDSKASNNDSETMEEADSNKVDSTGLEKKDATECITEQSEVQNECTTKKSNGSDECIRPKMFNNCIENSVTEDPLYLNKELKDVSSDNGNLDNDDNHSKSSGATKRVSVSESELLQTVGGDPESKIGAKNDKEEESISSTREMSKSKLTTFPTASSNSEKSSSNSTPSSDGKQWTEEKLVDSNNSSRQKSISSLSKNGTKSTLTFKDALKSLVNEERLLNSSSPQPLQPTAEISGDFPLAKEASSFTVLESKPNQGVKRPLKSKEKGDLKKFRHVPAQDELISEESVESGKSKEKSIKNLRRIRRKDLEDLVLELFMDKVLYEHELGNQRDLCKRLETTLEANRKKAAQFHKEIEDFKKVTQRLQAEHTNRKGQLVTPVKVKRSVGIQATPHIISKGIMHARTVSSAMKTIAPRINSATSPSNQVRSNVVTSPPNPTLSPIAAIIPPKTVKLQDFSISNSKQISTIQNANVMSSQTIQTGSQLVTQNSQMLMINSSQLIPVAQHNQNGGITGVPLQLGARIVQTPIGKFSSPSTISSAVNNTMAVVPRNSAIIDLTDDDDITKGNRVPVSGVLVQRNPTTPTSQFVALPRTTVGQFLLLPSNNGQTTTTLVVNKVPGITQSTGTVTTNILPAIASRVATTRVTNVPNNRMIIGNNLVLENSSKHPAPLPNTPIQQIAGISKKLPPLPLLKLSHKNNSIVLSWNMAKTEEHETISSYQLYAYQEGSTPPTSSLWKKVGSVKALELPMACTLTQFMPGHVYHFAVRAVDIRSRMGPFSIPRSIRLGQ